MITVLLTCLLICYNPRDSTEEILVKTGTLVRIEGQGVAGGGSNAGANTGTNTPAKHGPLCTIVIWFTLGGNWRLVIDTNYW